MSLRFLLSAARIVGASLLLLMLIENVCRADEPVTITHGPMLGGLSENGIGILARTSSPGEFHVHYGLSADALDQRAPTVETKLDDDCTGWVQLSGLKSGTRYYYRTIAGETAAGPGGSFRTLSSADQFRHPKLNPKGRFNFRFEFACDNNQSPTHGNGPSIPTCTTMLPDIPREARLMPMYCVVQINNVFNNPTELGGQRWVAYPQPQVIFQYYDGRSGDLRYAESISLTGESTITKREWSQRQQDSVDTKE